MHPLGMGTTSSAGNEPRTSGPRSKAHPFEQLCPILPYLEHNIQWYTILISHNDKKFAQASSAGEIEQTVS